MVESGVCFMTLCDSSYPTKLAFHYLKDLQREFDKLDRTLMERVSNPYSFLRLDTIIGSVRKKYVDTKTQANILKMKTEIGEDLDVITDDLSDIIARKQKHEILEKMKNANLSDSPIWGSKMLEIIAVKWIPIGILVNVAVLLLWSSFVFKDEFQ
ncbi:unnamed protein product [Cuscuta europaea]|nr:unnamed protein product [Cuscuta europaea]